MQDKFLFLNVFSESLEKNIISKCIISNIKKIISEKIEYKSIQIKTIETKNGRMSSWVFKYPTKDITTNFTITEASKKLEELLGSTFQQADLFLIDKSVHLQFLKNGKTHFYTKNLTEKRLVDNAHNKVKNRILDDSAQDFLSLLGVFSKDGLLKKDKTDKYIQINKYLEFFAQSIKETELNEHIKVMDMGSGKGYLTFATYYYLQKYTNLKPTVVGIEYRQDMVDLCNSLAKQAHFEGLEFEQGTIENHPVDHLDVLIALHACDTATDQAIFKGIKAGAQVIMVAPCCHKEIRKQIKGTGPASLFSKYGSIEERTAESITDLVRCLLLESEGYLVKAFEFISPEHTPKNLMITATRKNKYTKKPEKIKELNELKELFGIKSQYLEKLLKS